MRRQPLSETDMIIRSTSVAVVLGVLLFFSCYFYFCCKSQCNKPNPAPVAQAPPPGNEEHMTPAGQNENDQYISTISYGSPTAEGHMTPPPQYTLAMSVFDLPPSYDEAIKNTPQVFNVTTVSQDSKDC